MIIEFVGLSGTGKTTAAKRTALELGVEYININGIVDKLLYPIVFVVRYPINFIWLFWHTVREAGMSFRRQRYMLFVLASMGSRDAKAIMRGKHRTVVLDEGLTQYGLSLYRHEVKRENVIEYLSRVAGARDVRYMYESRDVRLQRMRERGRIPRVGIEPDHEAWLTIREKNGKLFRSILTDTREKLCYILPEYDERTDTHLYHIYEFIEELKNRMNLKLIVEKDVGGRQSVITRFLHDVSVLSRAKRFGYKNVYVHYSFIGALAGILCGMKVFYWNCGMPWLYRRGWFRERAFRFILKHAVLITGCQSLATEYSKQYTLLHEPRILPNWINLGRFGVVREPHETKTVLFVHHLSNRKGADMILPTARELPDVDFVVIGDGPEFQNIKTQMTNVKNIQLVGRVPNKEIASYFAKANVFFMPSEEEGFPRVLLESMAVGVPYVASDVGCVRSITPQELQPYLVTDRTPHNFAQKIKQLLDLEARLPSRLDGALREHVEQFGLGNIADQFLSLFITPPHIP